MKVELKFAFVSRHVPTASQLDLAAAKGVVLEHVGDRDAFAFPVDEIRSAGFAGVVVVHPWAALTAFRAGLSVGVFNNVNRAAVGEPLRFETTDFHIADATGWHCATCANSLGELCDLPTVDPEFYM